MKKYILLLALFANLAFASIATAATQQDKFLLLSDIHFSPFITCQKDTACPLIDELRQASPSDWDAIFVKNGENAPSPYGADTNATLFTAALKKAVAISLQGKLESDYNYVLVTGDTLGHKYLESFQEYSSDPSPAAYQAFVNKTFHYIQNHLQKYFPTLSVYMVVGNNDAYTQNNDSQPDGAFYSDMNKLWSRTILDIQNRAAFRKTFAHAGYYEVQPDKNSNNRLIVLNSIVNSKKGTGDKADKAAQDQMQWLEQRLATARAEHARVILAYHVPNGIDPYATSSSETKQTVLLWKPTYNEQFMRLLGQYRDVVSTLITGHLHSDAFQLIGIEGGWFYHPKQIPNLFGPAVTPSHNNNPAFKVINYDAGTFDITNFQTYIYDMGATEKQWRLEYDFNQTYQPTCVEHCTLASGYRTIQRTGTAAESYQIYFATSTNSDPITTQHAWDPYYWCASQHQSQKGFELCVAGGR